MHMKKVSRFVIFNRHGHRAPSSPLNAADNPKWIELLPTSNDIIQASKLFPIQRHPELALQRDLATYPHGCLTKKGTAHLTDTGKKLINTFPSIKGIIKDSLTDNYSSIDNKSIIRVNATNYQRTQLSAQMLLNGMYIQCGVATYDQTIVNKLPVVNVRSLDSCSMSFYDGKPHLANQFLSRVQSLQSFREAENHEDILYAKELMIKMFPAIHSMKANSKKFDWLAAFDYFICYKSHDLKIDDTMVEVEMDIIRHTIQRYRFYYTDKVFLTHIAIPLLVDVRDSILEGCDGSSSSSCSSSSKSTLSIFSGHDINILALLYATDSTVLNDIMYWPDYGCTLVFQLEEIAVDVSNISSNDSVDDRRIFVYLDNQPNYMNINGVIKEYITIKELNNMSVNATFQTQGV